jgi:hypothetical protein
MVIGPFKYWSYFTRLTRECFHHVQAAVDLLQQAVKHKFPCRRQVEVQPTRLCAILQLRVTGSILDYLEQYGPITERLPEEAAQ